MARREPAGVGSLTDVSGILLGHAHDTSALTGCSAVLFDSGAVAGLATVGSATGSREVSALSPWGLVRKIHGLLFAGGSAFGLSAADGVIRFLEENGVGFPVGELRVPVVPAAIIFDLHVGDSTVRPDPAMGYAAARAAVAESDERGSVGAGIGATVGKVAGMDLCMRGGLGMASGRTPAGAVVAALAVVNAFGDVCDSAGQIVAGARSPDSSGFLDSEKYITEKGLRAPAGERNTTLCLVATDAGLDRPKTHKLARLAVAGLYRSVRPAGTMVDGDMVFAAGTGKVKEDLTVIGVTAVKLLSRAIMDAVVNADSVPGIPSVKSLDRSSQD